MKSQRGGPVHGAIVGILLVAGLLSAAMNIYLMKHQRIVIRLPVTKVHGTSAQHDALVCPSYFYDDNGEFIGDANDETCVPLIGI